MGNISLFQKMTKSVFLCSFFLVFQYGFIAAQQNAYDKTESQASYKILVVLPCYRGHFNPGSGIARALIERNHKVSIFMTDSCEDLAKTSIPGAFSYDSRPVQFYAELEPGSFLDHLDYMQQILVHNATTRLVPALEDYAKELEKVDFDAIFMDILCYGATPFGMKHNIPTVSQFMGVIPRAVNAKNVFDFLEAAVEDPRDFLSILPGFFHSLIFYPIYHFFISWPMFSALSAIHQKFELPSPNYSYGLFPISYVQQNSIYIAHGADPIVIDAEYSLPNVYPIGFIPDDILYPDIQDTLKEWLESRDGSSPIVYVSLGTVLKVTADEMKSMLSSMQQQQEYYFVWAVRKTVFQEMGYSEPIVNSDRVFAAPYLPQGKVLQHPKVKVFVTHCGSNSIQDGVFAMKPMLTYPGVGDQPKLSNSVVANQVAILMTSFTYEKLESSLKTILEETTYKKMTEKLRMYKKRQIELGGFKRGAEIIEGVIEKTITVNKTFDPLDGFGVRYQLVSLTLCSILLSIVVVLAAVLYKILACAFGISGRGKEKTY